jgi:hypothetical protein
MARGSSIPTSRPSAHNQSHSCAADVQQTLQGRPKPIVYRMHGSSYSGWKTARICGRRMEPHLPLPVMTLCGDVPCSTISRCSAEGSTGVEKDETRPILRSRHARHSWTQSPALFPLKAFAVRRERRHRGYEDLPILMKPHDQPEVRFRDFGLLGLEDELRGALLMRPAIGFGD